MIRAVGALISVAVVVVVVVDNIHINTNTQTLYIKTLIRPSLFRA